MAVDHIRYDLLAQEALRGVVRTVLGDVAKKGLPGEHHFYISFDTRAEGVHVSPRLLAQYPEEMTIVLQHQFWDLRVTEDRFQVGLSFGGIPERLVVPFAAVKGFFDPSVQFGLQFEQADAQAEGQAKGDVSPSQPPASSTSGPKAPPFAALPTAANPPPRATEDDPDKPAGGADVVRLDRFRKK
jgi:hypothetical protein